MIVYNNISTTTEVHYNGNNIVEVYCGDNLVWSKETPDYLRFEALEDGVQYSFTKRGTGDDIEYSMDSGKTWASLASDVQTPAVSSGDVVMWRADMTPNSSGSYSTLGIGTFSATGDFNVLGNAMSLTYKDEFKDKTVVKYANYASLFSGNTHVINAEGMRLDSILKGNDDNESRCYYGMFNGCSNLKTLPSLSATTNMGNNTKVMQCFAYMFANCTSLATVPKDYLPSMSLPISSYECMFNGCTSLTDMPDLLATDVNSNAYTGMFKGCTSLTGVTDVLPAETIYNGTYMDMFNGCTSLTKAPEISATSCNGSSAMARMFMNCTSLRTPPSELKPLVLNTQQYASMFYNCKKLETAPILSATTTNNNGQVMDNMFNHCEALVTAPEIHVNDSFGWGSCGSMFANCTSLEIGPSVLMPTNIGTGSYYLMFLNCYSLKKVPKINATHISGGTYEDGSGAMQNMFANCSGLTTYDSEIKIQQMYNRGDCKGMFSGCTSLTATPVSICVDRIPFEGCHSMYINCTSLVEPTYGITATTIGYDACDSMFARCASLSATPVVSGINGEIAGRGFWSAFANCISLQQINFGTGMTATSVGDAAFFQTFMGCSAATASTGSLTITGSVGTQGCYQTYYGCTNLRNTPFVISPTSVNTQGFDRMCSGCTALEEIRCGTGQCEASGASAFSYTYADCTALTTSYGGLEIVGSIGQMSLGYTFTNCKSITSLPFIFSPTSVGVSGCICTCSSYVSTGDTSPGTASGACTSLTNVRFCDSGTTVNNPSYGAFFAMFNGCSALTCTGSINLSGSTSELCCYAMFCNTNVTYTPVKIPENKRIEYMSFMWTYAYCRSLETIGYDINVTEIVYWGFGRTFNGCTSLKEAPSIYANAIGVPKVGTTFQGNGCKGMFCGCTSMTGGSKYLTATDLRGSAYELMFANCTNMTEAMDELPATTGGDSIYAEMFEGCRSLIKAPNIEVETPGSQMCYRMFSGCTLMTKAPDVLKPNIVTQLMYVEMFSDCKSLVTAPDIEATECIRPNPYVTPRNMAQMFAGCSSLKNVPPKLPTVLNTECFAGMFKNCKSLEKVPLDYLPSNPYWGCYTSMFDGCSNLTQAPELLGANLEGWCYKNMFSGCNKLNYIKCLAVNGIGSNLSTDQWVSSVANTGTFVKAAAATSWSTGNNGIPSNWTVEDAS